MANYQTYQNYSNENPFTQSQSPNHPPHQQQQQQQEVNIDSDNDEDASHNIKFTIPPNNNEKGMYNTHISSLKVIYLFIFG
jgi:hypothetical protein